MASTLWQSTAADDDREPPSIDTSVAHIARVYDYWLGGKNHFAADREAGDEAVRAYPDMSMSVRQNRAFLQRAVRYLAGAGVRQFLDIGTGLPSSDNTHEVALMRTTRQVRATVGGDEQMGNTWNYHDVHDTAR